MGGYERAFLFSCGYFCAESHCGGRGGSQGKRHRTQQTQRFQSDPPRAGTRIGAERVYGRPTWTACGTRSIGRIPQYGKRGRRKQPSVGFAAAIEGGNERHAAFNNANTAIEGVDPDVLYLLSSTSEAYSWLIKLLCDAGDAVLAPKPGYPLIESIARLECVDTVEYQLQFDGSWFIDIAELERLLSEPGGERIRALVLINPNNPTGSYVKPTERARIVTLCREHGIALSPMKCSSITLSNLSPATHGSRGSAACSPSP